MGGWIADVAQDLKPICLGYLILPHDKVASNGHGTQQLFRTRARFILRRPHEEDPSPNQAPAISAHIEHPLA